VLVAIGWVMFRAADVSTALDFYRAMLNPFSGIDTDLVSLGLGRRNLLALLIGVSVFFLPRSLVVGRSLESSTDRWVDPARLAVLCVVLPYVAVLVTSTTFSPFLYFQF
jgi:alginate O-acetyltransferase complex protein AlgI